MDFRRSSCLGRKFFYWLLEDDVLELHVSVDDSAVVTVVQSICKLQHDLCYFTLRHLSVLKPFPVLVELASRQILHHDDQLLLLCSWDGINKFDNVLVAEPA